jgi:hypothetical protein
MPRDVKQYRIYFLDAVADKPSVEPFECRGDKEAYATARERAGQRPFELWSGARLVVRKDGR